MISKYYTLTDYYILHEPSNSEYELDCEVSISEDVYEDRDGYLTCRGTVEYYDEGSESIVTQEITSDPFVEEYLEDFFREVSYELGRLPNSGPVSRFTDMLDRLPFPYYHNYSEVRLNSGEVIVKGSN